jgi:hypothetical protein
MVLVWEVSSPIKINAMTTPLLIATLVGAVVAGCSNLSLPRANRYHIEVGENGFVEGTSVKAHGNWIEVQRDKGPIWINEDYVKSISPIQ